MLRKVINYVDFNGKLRNEKAYFHISKAEMTRAVAQGVIDKDEIKAALTREDNNYMFNALEKFIRLAYGQQSEDGTRFHKDPGLTDDFMRSPAYDAFFSELLGDMPNALEFVKGVFPADLTSGIEKTMAELDVDNPKVKEAVAQIADIHSKDEKDSVPFPPSNVPNTDARLNVYDDAFEAAVQKAVEERLKLAGIGNLS